MPSFGSTVDLTSGASAPNDPAGLNAAGEVANAITPWQYVYEISGNNILRKLDPKYGTDTAPITVATKDAQGRWIFDNPSYPPDASLLTKSGLGDTTILYGGKDYRVYNGTLARWDTTANKPSDLSIQQKAEEEYNAAKAANKAREIEIGAGYQTRYSEAMKTLEGMGAQESKDITSAYGNLAASQQQDLTSRGFGGTTIMPTMRAGVERQKTDALARLNERLRTQKLGYQTGLSGDYLGFRERVTDAYPDINTLAQYIYKAQV